jgi:hypothetical protein
VDVDVAVEFAEGKQRGKLALKMTSNYNHIRVLKYT